MEVRPQMVCHINQDIPGLRKKRVAFAAKPSSQRYWNTWSSFERNGMINQGISRNYTRIMFPFAAAFMLFYVAQPLTHGNVYVKHYNNFQWDALYFKFSQNRPLFTDQTITRLA